METPEGRRPLRFASAEDTLLHKLVWYERGHRVSDRQWGDVIGLIRVQAENLDVEYLRHWAAPLGVAELLGFALRGEVPPPGDEE